MTQAQDRIRPDIVSETLKTKGWARLDVAPLLRGDLADAHLLELAANYEVGLDPSPGRRWRAYRAGLLGPDGFQLLEPQTYLQSKVYNEADGGKERVFEPLSDTVVLSRTVQGLIRLNAEIAKAARPEVFSTGAAQVGLHLISYRPAGALAAYASPIWLHRDDERYVAVHLLALTRGLRGGDNVIEPRDKGPVEMFALTQRFETLLLTQQVKHAVTPCYADGETPERRDVLLVTFA